MDESEVDPLSTDVSALEIAISSRARSYKNLKASPLSVAPRVFAPALVFFWLDALPESSAIMLVSKENVHLELLTRHRVFIFAVNYPPFL